MLNAVEGSLGRVSTRMPGSAWRGSCALLIALMALIVSCDRGGGADLPDDPESKQTADHPDETESCRERAATVVRHLQKYEPVRPGFRVEFELPEADGKEPPAGIVLQVGPAMMKVEEVLFDIKGVDHEEPGDFSRALVRAARDELEMQGERQLRKLEAQGETTRPRLLLAVHPNVDARTVESLVSGLAHTHDLVLLAQEEDAGEPAERTKLEWLEPELVALEAEDNPQQAATSMKRLETRIMGDCDARKLRTTIGRRIGVAELTRQRQLVAKPLPDQIAECGCDTVDLRALQAALEWALAPQHPPLVALESSFEEAFANPDSEWREVVARHAE